MFYEWTQSFRGVKYFSNECKCFVREHKSIENIFSHHHVPLGDRKKCFDPTCSSHIIAYFHNLHCHSCLKLVTINDKQWFLVVLSLKITAIVNSPWVCSLKAISCLKSQTNNPKLPCPGNTWAYWACAVSASIYPSIIIPVYLSIQGARPLTVTAIQVLHLLFGKCQLEHNKDMRKKRRCDWMMNQYSGRRYKKMKSKQKN